MTRTPALAALTTTVVLLLGACGASDDEPAASAPTPSTAAPSSASPTATPVAATTTPAPTPSTTAPTAAAPTGKLISYETEDGGVMITRASDTGKLTGAPSDFKAFIARELEDAAPEEGCTEKPQISVDRLDTGGWARGGHFIPQCGGYATLWARSGGSWQAVWSGQSLVECSTLTKHRFPARVAGKQCLEGDATVPYAG
nr:hypothetical protein [Aeromicrobium sp.]